MNPSSLRRVALSTGVGLDVATAGPEDGEPIVFLHGFPESHRTWRNQLAGFSDRYFTVAPDQRGFAGSSRPEGVENYTADKIIGDLIALVDALGIGRFTLAGHDWGGAIAWGAALRHPDRIGRLVIANAPHPFIFQKTLIEDREQRVASQYMRMFRNPGMEQAIEAMGLATFVEKSFSGHVDLDAVAPGERAIYEAQWSAPGAMTAMLNWYRAAPIIVPEPDEKVERPAFLDAPFPKLSMPVLVVWGMRDKALLPIQLEGLDKLVDDLTLVKVDSGHFVPWEEPAAVNAAIEDFLEARPPG